MILLLGQQLFATHIVGGEIMYKYISNNTNSVSYRIDMFLYIDCDNGDPGAIAQDVNGYLNVYSYNKNFNNYTLYTNNSNYYSLNNARSGPVRVASTNYNCIKNKPNLCVDKYTYSLNITIPINNGGYVISFERCCRNNSIGNIFSPGSTGATYWTHIPGFAGSFVDNSPVFKSLPPNFLCTNAPLNFDHSATDSDGDSLVYELYHPYLGASTFAPLPNQFGSTNPIDFSNVAWASGYNTTNNQIDGNPTLTIDSRTGRLTLTPTKTGQFVIGIKVVEYRNGVKIGETKRDFQFNVTDCIFDVVASFFVPKVNCQGNVVSFTNLSQGGVKYYWEFGDPATRADTANSKNSSYTYSTPGNYTVKLITYSSGPCRDSTLYDIFIKKNFKVKLPDDTLVCGTFNKTLKSDVEKKSYRWNTGETTESIVVNKGGKYWVDVIEAPCTSSDTIEIINDLSFIDLGPDSVICRDSFVQFTYDGKPGYTSYLWNDSTTLQSVFIPKLGTYWVTSININKCVSSDSITFVLYPPPKTKLNDTLFCKGTSVTLDGSNLSIKTKLETNYLWSTGETNPIITTFTPGVYYLKVRNKLCTLFDTVAITHIETGFELGPDTFYCGPVDRWIYPQTGFARYQWHDFAEVINYHALSPGKKKLTITTKEGCIESDSVFISQYPSIDGGLGNDTAICVSSAIILTASDSMVSYLWNTGSTNRSISIRDAGLYIVTIQDSNGCIENDSINIKEQSDALPIDLFMPNAFTPNDDFVNETYPGNKYSDPGSPYLLRIFNRWGEKIFESNSPSMEWNGTYNNKLAPQDVYVYYVKYVGCDDVERWFRGTFTLMR
ncbi:MAG: gliding motility-associated C-terminal domain-containing protein [Bacteroidia bacterium]|nr:gliding motility-associated C-terminal domain-containing protein [Bacteroidia bacterium]